MISGIVCSSIFNKKKRSYTSHYNIQRTYLNFELDRGEDWKDIQIPFLAVVQVTDTFASSTETTESLQEVMESHHVEEGEDWKDVQIQI